jgi:hypothetical protein
MVRVVFTGYQGASTRCSCRNCRTSCLLPVPGKVDEVEAQLGRVSLAGTDEALRRAMEDMRFERESLHRELIKLEEDKIITQRELSRRQVWLKFVHPRMFGVLCSTPGIVFPALRALLQEDLQRLNASLVENVATRDELDAIIRETEGAYRKIMEGSAALLDMVKRRTPRLPDDLLYSPGPE